MVKESPTLKVLCHFFMLFFDSLSIPCLLSVISFLHITSGWCLLPKSTQKKFESQSADQLVLTSEQ